MPSSHLRNSIKQCQTDHINSFIKGAIDTTAMTFHMHTIDDPTFKLIYDRVCSAIRWSETRSTRDQQLGFLRDTLNSNEENEVNLINKYFADDWKMTLLSHAVQAADAEVVNLLLAHGANPNLLVGVGLCQYTCLFTCCQFARDHQRLSIAEALIKHGADINVNVTHTMDPYNNPYSTALHFACQNRNYDIVILFLQHHANVHAVDSAGRTPLEMAVTPNENVDYPGAVLMIVNELVAHGANPNAINEKTGQTLLHRAAEYPYAGYNWDVVRYLINCGVQDIKDSNGMTACDVSKAACRLISEKIEMSTAFCIFYKNAFQENHQRIRAFAMGNHHHGGIASRRIPGAHDWQSRGSLKRKRSTFEDLLSVDSFLAPSLSKS